MKSHHICHDGVETKLNPMGICDRCGVDIEEEFVPADQPYAATSTAREFVLRNKTNLSPKAQDRFVEALARLLNEAYSAGYTKGHSAADYNDTGSS